MTNGLARLLGITDHELVAFVGGGGKSTLTLGIGREIADAGRRVVMTTTTKMGTDQIPTWATVCHSAPEVHAAVADGRPAYLLGAIDGSKVIGVSPEVVDEVFEFGTCTVLTEADGTRRRPLKAPGPNEPVIPAATTLVVIVAGMDAIGGRIADVCHRPERVTALTGRGRDDTVRPEDVATVLTHPAGGFENIPAGARAVIALTKVTAERTPAAERIRSLIVDIPIVTIAAKNGA